MLAIDVGDIVRGEMMSRESSFTPLASCGLYGRGS
jgi:hypothetical protein